MTDQTTTTKRRHPLARIARMLFGIFIVLTFVFGLAVWAALLLQLF